MDPFQNKAKVNIQSIKEGRILPQHTKIQQRIHRWSSFMFLFLLCVRFIFFYHLAGESEGLLQLFHKFWPVNTEVYWLKSFFKKGLTFV